jgi:fructose-bisphosphate aldolase class II
MSAAQFSDLISRGCAKVNISTALKIAFMTSAEQYMQAHPAENDPSKLLPAQGAAVMDMAKHHIQLFGSAGRAWS